MSQEFDLSAFENVESGTFTVLDRDGDEMLFDGKPVKITMHGTGSKPQVAAERKKIKAAKQVLYAGIGGRVAKNAEEEEFAREAEYLAACTISIENFPIPGGALALYSNQKLSYITKQAQRFLAEDANFKPRSGSN